MVTSGGVKVGINFIAHIQIIINDSQFLILLLALYYYY